MKEESCHLRGPVELIQTQFPRFAGILGIRRRRHGDRAQTPARAPTRRSGLGRGGRGKGRERVRGPPSRRPRPSGASPPPPQRRRDPSPGSRRPRCHCRSAARWARAPVPSSLGLQPLLRQQLPPPLPPWPRRWGPTSLPPAPSLLSSPARGDVTRHSRRGWDATWKARFSCPPDAPAHCQELASLESRATWGPCAPPPSQHSRAANLSQFPSRGPHPGPPLRGRGLGLLGPREGSGRLQKGHLPHSASPSGSGE